MSRPALSRVLIVDDNVDTADTLGELLSESGYRVQVAYRGEAALRAFLDGNPEVVLLDVGLPDLDGLEVARRMRCAPGGSGALLVAVTGYHADVTRDGGFDHHMVKPVPFDALVRWMEGRGHRPTAGRGG